MSRVAHSPIPRARMLSRSDGLDETLADGYATVHELETRTLQLERHCEALLANGADAEQIGAVMRARRALNRELEGLRERLERAANRPILSSNAPETLNLWPQTPPQLWRFSPNGPTLDPRYGTGRSRCSRAPR